MAVKTQIQVLHSDTLLTTAEAAALLGVHPGYMYKLSATGRVPCYGVGNGRGGTRLWRREDVERYRDERARPGRPAGSRAASA